MRSLNTRIDHYGRNDTGGRDLIVGDVHGWFTRLASQLRDLGFNKARDRLFCVGDLVDRGPESAMALEWLKAPWFKCVRGNHEEAAIAWADQTIDPDHYRSGFDGGWNMQQDPLCWGERAEAFKLLPVGIELETEAGLVGILHADCPVTDWATLKGKLADTGLMGQATAGCCVWGRDRFKRLFDGNVAGVRAVVVGHSEVERMTSLDNVIFIDTTAGRPDKLLTIIDAHTLREASAPSLTWS